VGGGKPRGAGGWVAMKPGDLVHVTADNYYFGLGLILKHPQEDLPGYDFYVMTPDGKRMYYFREELEPVQHDPP